MSPTLEFQLRVYAASVAGHRANPYNVNDIPQDVSRRAWADAREALVSMPPEIEKQLEYEEAEAGPASA